MRKIQILQRTQGSFQLVAWGSVQDNGMIVDCPATLDEELYEKIEDRILPGQSHFPIEYNGEYYEVEITFKD